MCCGISDLFDEIFISSAYGYKKPDKKFFEALLKKYELRRDRCLMIGNELKCDVLGAINAGIDSYYIHSGLSDKDKIDVKATYTQDKMSM